MKQLREPIKGFTLLELILALGIIGLIIITSLGAIRLGASTQEAGYLKIDTFQRLRLIENQLTQKIKSIYPIFIVPKESIFTSNDEKKRPLRLLAFKGTSNSMRFVTFSPPLTSQQKSAWMHETLFFVGKHPKSGKSGIIMSESTIFSEYGDHMFNEYEDHVFSNSDQKKYFLLSENVANLKFRYYQINKLSPAELELKINNSKLFEGKWVKSIKQDPFQNIDELKKDAKERTDFIKKNKMSLPRAIEISIGLSELNKSDSTEGATIIYSPPIIVPLYSGMSFALPNRQDENS